jgi:hypothetical protein
MPISQGHLLKAVLGRETLMKKLRDAASKSELQTFSFCSMAEDRGDEEGANHQRDDDLDRGLESSSPNSMGHSRPPA